MSEISLDIDIEYIFLSPQLNSLFYTYYVYLYVLSFRYY